MTVEAPPPRAADRFQSLDALRGICALLVALYHFDTPGLISTSALVRHSYIFVDYFFVLSGFVIAFSYGDRIETRQISLGRFMALRFGRIYPLHIAVILVLLLLELAVAGAGIFSSGVRDAFTGQRSLPSLVQNILLLQALGVQDQTTWNGPSWSIAAEMWSYLLFGLVLLVPRRWVSWVAAGLSSCALALLIARLPSINATYDFGFVRCVYGFGLGLLLYRLFRKIGPIGGHVAEGASLGLAVAFVWFAEGRWTFAAPAIFAIGIYVLASAKGFISKLLTHPPFQLLGLVSYSIYMIHVFVAARLMQLLSLVAPEVTRWNGTSVVVGGSPLIGDLLSIVDMIVLVGCSYISYRLIERPGREWTRRRLAHRAISRQVAPAE